LNPLRILIIFLLFYLLFRLLIGKSKKGPAKNAGEKLPAQDVLVEDPICKVCVPKKQALTLKDNDKIVYFCSTECRKKFIATKGANR
jgi:YHS domain-containing protein